MFKRKMKPLVMTTVLATVLLLSACTSNTVNGNGGKSNNTPSTPKTENAAPETDNTESDKKIVVGFSQIGAESGWRDAETQSIKDTFGSDAQFELKFSDAQQKQENQIKAIRTFISQKVDAIALAPVVESGWETVLEEAKAANIPVFLLDRTVKVSDESLYTSFIGSDFILEGQNAAKTMMELLGEDKQVNIVELQGTVGASAANDRQQGFKEIVDANPNYKIIKSQSGDFTRAKGKEVMEAFLKSDGKNIQAVYAHNDDMALGAIQAIEEYGLKPGVDIFIVSVDGIKPAFEAIRDGKLNVTVECNPLLGPQLKQAILDYKDGKTLDKWIKSDEDVYFGQKAIDALPNRTY
ncbi:ABC transporter substrate-binding protein [Paenibacillus endoradicis]|uniref:ABC transporter substrate-binding protein n=1 Tax=Paenibacillus endoradicis TaxID=2972487 RepID=UPI002159347C|nr:ABC transporter substrate-binding protein [Paenibacillus endoradicis]MCR8657799.1 ABC transporter substrate-binding protein [Paenibacillus endoradicis]